MPYIEGTPTPDDTARAKRHVGRGVTIQFAQATQRAHVVAVTKAGNVQVRAWNGTRRAWYPTIRTIDPRAIIAADDQRDLPIIPAREKRAKAR